MNPAMVRLVVDVSFRGKVLETIPFDAPTLSVGRMPENDIILDNLGVSRFHARLQIESGRVFLEDAGSENGSLVNGERATGRREIAPGDRIAIGKHELCVRRPVEGDPSERPARRKSDAWDGNRTYVLGSPPHLDVPNHAPPSPPIQIPRKEPQPMTAPKSAVPDTVELDYDFAGSLTDEPEGPATVRLSDSNPPPQPPMHAGFIVQRDGKLE